MNEQDIRWEQRFRNYQKALKNMEESALYIRNLLDHPENDWVLH